MVGLATDPGEITTGRYRPGVRLLGIARQATRPLLRLGQPHQKAPVLLQPEMEKRHIRVKVELGRSFSHAEAPEELYACREGRHPPAPSDRPRPCLRPLR